MSIISKIWNIEERLYLKKNGQHANGNYITILQLIIRWSNTQYSRKYTLVIFQRFLYFDSPEEK